MALDNPYDEINYADLEDLRYISRGNFGQIYRASYFGTDVAVKQLLDIGNQLMHKYIEREMSLLMYVRVELLRRSRLAPLTIPRASALAITMTPTPLDGLDAHC